MADTSDTPSSSRVKEIRHHNTTHGMTNTTEFRIWGCMIMRCTNPNDKQYAEYGGRGIVVCEEWLKSFVAFYRDMGPRHPDLQIDRINNDGPYCKENCRWATRKEQARNRRSTRRLTHKGESLPIAEWTERMGFTKNTIRNRLVAGWSIADAIETGEWMGCGKRKPPPQ